MRKVKYCKECNCKEKMEYICDTCGKSSDIEWIPISLDFGYGHDLDGNRYDFCSNECLLIFIENEIKKEIK